MSIRARIVVFCRDCDAHVGEDTASWYEDCDSCGSTFLDEETYYYCSKCDFCSNDTFDVCPNCGEPA